METAIPPVFNLEIECEGGRVRKSDRKGILLEGDADIPRCNGIHYTSACTDTDGACGLHGQHGWPKLELQHWIVIKLPQYDFEGHSATTVFL